MAEIWPNEGLTHSLNIFPRNLIAIPASITMDAFSSQSATTVIGSADTLSSITACAYSGYQQATLGSASWGAPSATGGTVTVSYAQQDMGTAGAVGTANGFYFANAGTCIAQANFDDLTQVVLQVNDVLKITPSLGYSS